MKTLLESDEFRAELPGWALRGILCALNSAGWAVLIGFWAPVEIAGMAAGVAFWTVVFAVLCAGRNQFASWINPQAVAALKWATWVKIGITAFGWLLFWLGGVLHFEALSQMGMLGMIDTLLGLGSLAIVAFFAGLKGPEMVAAADSFGLTMVTTMLEGFAMAVVIGGIAMCLWTVWRLCDTLGLPLKFLPARRAG